MKQTYLRDQRGVAMLLELILVAVVLGVVGVAVYQAGHHPNVSSDINKPASPSSAEGVAATAAASIQKDSDADVSLSAAAETSADELSELDKDVTNLGGASDASF